MGVTSTTTESEGLIAASRRYCAVLAVEQLTDPMKARPPLDEPGAALDHDALERRPVVGVHVDRDRDERVLAQVLDLSALVAGGEVHLAAGQHVAHRHQVGHAAGAGGRHAAHALQATKSASVLVSWRAGRRLAIERLLQRPEAGTRLENSLTQRALPERVAHEEGAQRLEILRGLDGLAHGLDQVRERVQLAARRDRSRSRCRGRRGPGRPAARRGRGRPRRRRGRARCARG